MTDSGDQNFKDRVARISERQKVADQTRASTKKPLKFKKTRGAYTLRLLGALASGLLTIMLVRYVRFHMMGQPESGQILAHLIDIGISIVACLAIKELFRLHQPEFKAAQGIGIFLMVVGMHNLVFWMPATMSQAFSTGWVRQQQRNAVPNSIWLVGQYVEIGFKSQAEPDPALPRVNRLN